MYIHKYVPCRRYLCTYIRTYIHTYTQIWYIRCMCMYIRTYIHTYIINPFSRHILFARAYLQLLLHVHRSRVRKTCRRIHIYMYTYIHIYVHLYTYIHTYIHTNKYIHKSKYAHSTHVHMHIHTHIHNKHIYIRAYKYLLSTLITRSWNQSLKHL